MTLRLKEYKKFGHTQIEDSRILMSIFATQSSATVWAQAMKSRLHIYFAVSNKCFKSILWCMLATLHEVSG